MQYLSDRMRVSMRPVIGKGVRSGLGHRLFLFTLVLIFLLPSYLASEVSVPGKPSAESAPPKSTDTLGRDTPRGTVLGFLSAARRENAEIAALYLNTPLRGQEAEVLARQLAIVLDRRLPARLNEISDKPEGSLSDKFSPDEDLVGTISTAHGELDILVERVDRGKAGRVWLFSRATLDSIPGVYQELKTPPVEEFLPKFMVTTTIATIPLFHWLAILIGLPTLYLLTGLLSRLLFHVVGPIRHGKSAAASRGNRRLLPPPIRLLIVAAVIRWILAKVTLSLLARQVWSTIDLVIAILACVWLLILINGWVERYILARREGSMLSGSASLLRLGRRLGDGIILFAGLLFTLFHFGVNPTAALAGLGVGGIAVALAAQKTLENVIGGISLIFDDAVRVGDTLKLGDIQGTVEDVGLRSTRIRTPDRTLVSIPNGQIASMSLETLSARDKFWFHPIVGLRYETTPEQIRSITTGVRDMLTGYSGVDSSSVRVCLVRLGSFSLDLDVFAYVWSAEWNQFLQIQEELLLRIMDIVQQAGAEIAFPSQTMYIASNPAQGSKGPSHDFSTKFANESPQQIRISGQAGAGR